MNKTRAGLILTGLMLVGASVYADAVAPGDIVQTGLNGTPVVGEVIRSRGTLADLNLGQNNVVPMLDTQYMKVLQKAGSAAQASFAVGQMVRVPHLAGTTVTGRIMKVNGAYCEIDASQSGFTGWSKCPGSESAAGAAAVGGAAVAGKPPKPGYVTCAGKIEGRYAPSTGLPGMSIVFRSGKATVSMPMVGDEEDDCWVSGNKLLLHSRTDGTDADIDINDDGTLQTPLGELKKKGG
jgi:hypothetical protein